MKILYVETNFVIEHARRETVDAELIVRAAETQKLRLVVPVFSFYEAMQKEGREKPEREGWAKKLREQAKNLERKGLEPDLKQTFFQAAQGVLELNDLWKRGLYETIERLAKCAEVLPLDVTALATVLDLDQKLSKGDPWVAATIKRYDDNLDQTAHERLFLERDEEVLGALSIPSAEASAAVVKRWALGDS